MVLTKEQILAKEDLEKELVAVPEWGGSVYVRMMTGTERDEYEAQIFADPAGKNLTNYRARLLAYTVCKEDGSRIFETADDVKALGKKGVKALQRLTIVSQRLNAISDADVEDLAGK